MTDGQTGSPQMDKWDRRHPRTPGLPLLSRSPSERRGDGETDGLSGIRGDFFLLFRLKRKTVRDHITVRRLLFLPFFTHHFITPPHSVAIALTGG